MPLVKTGVFWRSVMSHPHQTIELCFQLRLLQSRQSYRVTWAETPCTYAYILHLSYVLHWRKPAWHNDDVKWIQTAGTVTPVSTATCCTLATGSISTRAISYTHIRMRPPMMDWIQLQFFNLLHQNHLILRGVYCCKLLVSASLIYPLNEPTQSTDCCNSKTARSETNKF
jgi:hypothetical protein